MAAKIHRNPRGPGSELSAGKRGRHLSGMASRDDSKLPLAACAVGESTDWKHIPHGGRKESAMGYNTEFDGEFVLSKPLDEETYYALEDLASSRHDEEGMPSIWCQWVVGNDWKSIRWDGGEKFYGYIGWIRYINNHFLLPKKVKLNGTVVFQGENPKDGGRIVATNGKIEVFWNYDDPTLSNYDGKSKRRCHIPADQGVDWINRRRTVFCDFFDLGMEISEDQFAYEQKMEGITIGNPRTLAIIINVSATPGTDVPINRGSKHPERERARIMSFDAVMPYVDGERGARARLEQLYKYTIRHYKKIMREWQNK